jgi:hypothetical protein
VRDDTFSNKQLAGNGVLTDLMAKELLELRVS